MKRGRRPGGRGDLGDRLDRADLVVGRLDGDDARPARAGDASATRPGRPGPGGRRPARCRRGASAPQRAACSTAECSTAECTTTCARPRAPGGRPSRPRWTASVPLAVKVTSSGRTPSASATASRALSSSSRASRAGAVQPARVGVPLVEGGQERLAGRRVQRLRGGASRSRTGRTGPGAEPGPVPRANVRGPPRIVDPDRGTGRRRCCSTVEADRERARSWVCNSPRQRLPRAPSAAVLGVRAAGARGCSRARPGTRSATSRCRTPPPSRRQHLRPVALGLGRRDGHRRHRLGPDLLRVLTLPPPQRRRDPGADALQPAARDLLHDRPGHHGARVLLLHRRHAGRRPRRRGRAPTTRSRSSASSGRGRSTTLEGDASTGPGRLRGGTAAYIPTLVLPVDETVQFNLPRPT